jgi:hypothetical protein
MGMFYLVGVKMIMFLAVAVDMNMLMGPVFYRSVHSPNKIGEAKADEKPGCCSASKRFN